MRGSRSKIIMAAIILAAAAVSCDRSIHYSENYTLEGGNWSMFDPARYSCAINDTVRTYNMELSLRTSTAYPYRNIYLFMMTTFPSGSVMTDTIHAMVTDEKGRWLGKGTGDVRELTIPYKSNVYFPEQGEYHFRVAHGMRDTILKGVYDMGIKISLREGSRK
ncbi:MAG: gliding motility lipoprotein GldH [Bacteroidales bacterium]|jgi:gliding motility-associated lipoprotein GldH|nr:gliding motility lipoprotein GldH [Bacteroidales bacterium]MCB9028457.1 gliding motility lipoprotein GldH [Bacteroidales bacterium]HOO67395.1 gliding motility lipoprotein GldH [Bacteroidales bacterium]HPE23572.1 gliding motility lipoprotein GldH [Bacteroidales bacterium]HPJ05697.1 gliding motility lipoprotein GldH [Bacteroidales bacterium]